LFALSRIFGGKYENSKMENIRMGAGCTKYSQNAIASSGDPLPPPISNPYTLVKPIHLQPFGGFRSDAHGQKPIKNEKE